SIRSLSKIPQNGATKRESAEPKTRPHNPPPRPPSPSLPLSPFLFRAQRAPPHRTRLCRGLQCPPKRHPARPRTAVVPQGGIYAAGPVPPGPQRDTSMCPRLFRRDLSGLVFEL